MHTTNGTSRFTESRMNGFPHAALHRRALRKVVKKEPDSIGRLVETVEADYQFRLGYLTVKSLIESANVTIVAEGDDRAQALATNLSAVWKSTLPHALRAFAHGRAAFEKTYRFERSENLAVVAGLDYLPVEYTRLLLDGEGSFAGIELVVKDETFRLGPERSWWFALDPTTVEPHGRSRYLGAALEVWKRRRRLEELEDVWYSKFVIGHGIARAPEKADVDSIYDAGNIGDVGAGGELLDPMDVMRQRCEEIESGGVLVLSSKRDENGAYLYDYSETAGQKDSSPLENRRKMLDVAALRSLGVPERALTQDGSVGSFALAQAHLQVLCNTAEGVLSQVATSFERYVIRKAVALNWPAGNRPSLELVYQPLGERRKELVIELVKRMLASPKLSPLLTDGTVDVNKLFEIANLPVREGSVVTR